MSGIEGVPVYVSNGAIGYGDPPGCGATGDDHMRYVLLPEPVAAALGRVAEAGRLLREAKDWPELELAWDELDRAITALDALDVTHDVCEGVGFSDG